MTREQHHAPAATAVRIVELRERYPHQRSRAARAIAIGLRGLVGLLGVCPFCRLQFAPGAPVTVHARHCAQRVTFTGANPLTGRSRTARKLRRSNERVRALTG
jgi:hypothetical protein